MELGSTQEPAVAGEEEFTAGIEPGGTSWLIPKGQPKGVSGNDLRLWRSTTEDIRALAVREGLSKGEVARRAEVSPGTFSPWYDGKYPGDIPAITERLRNWLSAHAERRQAIAGQLDEPEYVETPTAIEVVQALTYAQAAPAIVLITLGSGMSKTTVARRYAATRPHAHRVVLQPSTGSVYGVMSEIALTLNIAQNNPRLVSRAVGDRLRRNGRHTLLMIDEAQNLQDKAFNELRHYLDEYGCGIALLGNDEVYNRWGRSEPKEGFGQLHRRIGLRIHHLKPQPGDISAYLDAWGLEDARAKELLAVIGRKPGALGQIAETIRYAAMLAMPHGRKPNAGDVRRAWENRGGEVLR